MNSPWNLQPGGWEKIPWEGEFTLRSDSWAGLIASCGSFYLMVPLPRTPQLTSLLRRWTRFRVPLGHRHVLENEGDRRSTWRWGPNGGTLKLVPNDFLSGECTRFRPLDPAEWLGNRVPENSPEEILWKPSSGISSSHGINRQTRKHMKIRAVDPWEEKEIHGEPEVRFLACHIIL